MRYFDKKTGAITFVRNVKILVINHGEKVDVGGIEEANNFLVQSLVPFGQVTSQSNDKFPT
jgi:hypothetical protein